MLGDDPSAAIQRPLEDPDGITVGPNHELYVADANKVWKVWPNQEKVEDPPYVGGVELESGYELPLDIWDVTQASQVPLDQACGVAIDHATGALFVSSRKTNQVWRIETNGSAFLVAGTGETGFSGDGSLAMDAELNGPRGIALGRDSSLYIVDQENSRVRRVFPNGQITTVAGGGGDFPASSLPGTEANLSRPDGLAMGPNGVAYVGGAVDGDEPPHLFRASSPAGDAFGADECIVPSSDGKFAYRFNSVGRHLETLDVMTGRPALSFEYDAKNRLVSVEDVNSLETRIARNAAGQATDITGPYGLKTDLGYDSNGDLESVSAAVDSSSGRTTSFEYDPETALLGAVERGDGNRSEYDFDALGRVAKVKGPMGFAETYIGASGPGSQGASVTIPEASAGEDNYTRGSAGAELYESLTFADGDGQKFSETEKPDRTFERHLPGGAVLTGVMAASDQWGEQVRYESESTLQTPGGKTLTRTQTITTTGLELAVDGTVVNPLDYDTQQATVAINGAAYQRTYDRAAKTVTTMSPEGRTTVTYFDAAGRPIRLEVPGLADTIYTYDSDGRLETLTREAGGESRVTRWQYRSDGPIDTVIDPLGRQVAYDYDGVGRITAVTRPDDAATEFGYDSSGNVTSVSPPGRPSHAYAYEEGAGLVGYVPPSVPGDTSDGFTTAEIRYAYDEFTRPTAMILADGSSVENHYYQDFDRPSQLWVTPGSSGDTDEYYLTFDTDRNVIKKLYGPVNGIEFTYDSPLLTKVQYNGPSAGGIVNFAYDDSLRVSRIKLTGSDPTDYVYDNDSLLVQAGPLTITRDPENGLGTGTVVGSITTTRTPNGFGEAKEYAAAVDGGELFSQEMEHDALGRITMLTESIQGETRAAEYTYDEVGRLQTVTTELGTSRYYYDENGNQRHGRPNLRKRQEGLRACV